MKRHEEKKLINDFVYTYNQAHRKNFVVTRCPEEEKRNEEAVEAIATDGPLMIAIEHTRIQPFIREKHENDIFNKVVNSLEGDPKLCQPDWDSAMSMPVGVVPKGKDHRTAAAKELRQWLEANLKSCPEGESQHSIPNLPFDFVITITRCYVPYDPGYFSVSRDLPAERLAELQLTVQTALRMKLPKLVRADGDIKILLLERSDTLFVNSHFVEVLQKEIADIKPSLHPNEIWSVNTVYRKAGETPAFIKLWPEYRKYRFPRKSSPV